MTLEGIFSVLEGISRKLDNREGKIEKIKSDFDKGLGIGKEEHDKVVSLLDQFEDSEESLKQYDEQIDDTKDALGDLNDVIRDLRDELSKGTLSPTEQAKKQNELDDKLTERNRLIDKKDRLETGRNQEEKRNLKIKSKLNSKGITDTAKAVAANKQMDKDIASAAKGGGMSKALGKMKGNIYLMIADMLIKGVEWGIGKTTEYMKVFNENLMREMSASTTAAVSKMKAGIDSWRDAVEGAYSAQSLAVESQMAVMEAANANALANLKLANTWTNWIPIVGALNKAEEARMEMEQQLQKMDLENAQKRISAFGEYVKLTDDYIKKQDKSIHQYQALNGLTVAQTQSFEKRMLANGEAFAKFNKTIEDALEMQNKFAEQSGRAVNFSDEDYTKSFSVGRLVGEDNLTQFQAMMNIFNTSISGSTDIMYDMYNYANKMGLSQQRLTKNVLSNLKLASKYDFKNGSRGFMELAKWAENARMSLSSFGSAIEKVQSGGLEGVIKQGAGLQVLGGNVAMGADPIAMMFEAGADQQSYAKRIQSMLKGYGSFNKETGETTFSWGENQFLRAISEQVGMPVEDLKDMARGARQKEYVKAQMGGSTLSKENQDAVANKAQYNQETKRWYVNTIDGGWMDVADVTKENLSQILSNNKEENAEKYAQGTLGAVEKIEVTTKAIAAKLGATTFDDFIKTTETANKQTLESFTTNIGSISNAISTYRSESLKNQADMLKEMGTIDKSIKEAFGKVAAFAEETKRKQKEMEEDLAKYKNEKREQQATTVKEQEEYKDKYKNASNAVSRAWYAGRIKEGTELIKSGDKRDGWSGLDEGWTGIKTFFSNLFGEDKGNDYIKESDNVIETTKNRFRDGITSGNGKSMAVSAASVTPIHDGTARIAKSDPQDTALFAKTGGPFDKLFNGVFERIDEVYNVLIGGSVSNTRLGDNIDPIAKLYEAYDDPYRLRSMSGSQKLMMKAASNIMGINYSDLKDMMPQRNISQIEALPPKGDDVASSIKEQWNASLKDTTGSNAPSTSQPMELRISGSLDLKSNGQSVDIMGMLRENPLFIREISQLITQHISEAKDGGRGMMSLQRHY